MMETKAVGGFLGAYVHVSACLKTKPFHSGTSYGWVLREVYNRADFSTEPCDGCGKAAQLMGSDVYCVVFLDRRDHPVKETVLFVHECDMQIMPPDDTLRWPDGASNVAVLVRE